MRRHSFSVLLWGMLLCLALVLIACGGPPGQATGTPLPPGAPLPQPTVEFSAPTAISTPTQDTQAFLATQIASNALASTPETVVAATPTSNLLPESFLNQPTALGMVGATGTALYDLPGGIEIERLSPGLMVTIVGKSDVGDWYAVYLDSGRIGWVQAGSMRIFGEISMVRVMSTAETVVTAAPSAVATEIPEATATPMPPTPTAEVPTAQAVVIVDGLNIRGGPGTDFAIVGSLVRETSVDLVGRNAAGDWVQIKTPAGVGWVYAPLIEPSVPVETLPLLP